jgi:hypothetical protein
VFVATYDHSGSKNVEICKKISIPFFQKGVFHGMIGSQEEVMKEMGWRCSIQYQITA